MKSTYAGMLPTARILQENKNDIKQKGSLNQQTCIISLYFRLFISYAFLSFSYFCYNQYYMTNWNGWKKDYDYIGLFLPSNYIVRSNEKSSIIRYQYLGAAGNSVNHHIRRWFGTGNHKGKRA